MSILYVFLGIFKKLAIFVLFMAIAIPIRYGSTNLQYLTIRLLHSVRSLKYRLLSDRARRTLSPECRAFEDMLRRKPLAKLDLSADPILVAKILRSNNTLSRLTPKPSQCKIIKEIFEYDGHSVDAYWIDHPTRKFQAKSDKLLLYLHGGVYTMDSIDSYGGVECELSQIFDMSILHIEYRRTPEHSFPAAVDDAVAVYRALLCKNIPASQLVLMGDSAGGGLALLTVQALLALGIPVPRGVIALSPLSDLSSSGDSYIHNKEIDLMVSADVVTWFTSQFLGPNKSHLSVYDHLVSPIFGSFKGFPPMYINVGTAEILEDDSRRVVEKALDARVDVTFEEGLHLMHIYPLFFSYFPEALNSIENINKWIQMIFTDKCAQ